MAAQILHTQLVPWQLPPQCWRWRESCSAWSPIKTGSVSLGPPDLPKLWSAWYKSSLDFVDWNMQYLGHRYEESKTALHLVRATKMHCATWKASPNYKACSTETHTTSIKISEFWVLLCFKVIFPVLWALQKLQCLQIWLDGQSFVPKWPMSPPLIHSWHHSPLAQAISSKASFCTFIILKTDCSNNRFPSLPLAG